MKLGTWLLALCKPMLAKILLSLGFSVVTIVGLEGVLDQLKGVLLGNINSLPADMLQLFLFVGGGKALGMILGACATKLLLWNIQSATKILGTAPT